MNLKENIENLKLDIDNICKKFEKDPFKIKLIAVTKTTQPDIIEEAINLGLKDIGESYIQEAIEKFPKVNNIEHVKKHFIGHLQSNKAKQAVQLFDVIHSVDSKKLAKKLSRYSIEYNKIIDIFIEVNLCKEESKFGVKEEEIEQLIEKIKDMKNLNLIGLMTVAPNTEP